MLGIAGLLFLVVHALVLTWLVRHWRSLFGRDPNVTGDVSAVRYLRIVGVAIPVLFLTFRLFMMWIGLWIN